MITTFDIKGFKSVKSIHLDCKRINLFIGEPNTGKSNILEALGFLSFCGHGGNLTDYVRLGQMRDLFRDGFVAKGAWGMDIQMTGRTTRVSAELTKGEYRFSSDNAVFMQARQLQSISVNVQKQFDFVRFYRFRALSVYPSDEGETLLAPDGRNLVALLHAQKALRLMAGEYFTPSGLLFVIKPHEHAIEIQNQTEGVAVGIPYAIASDTLQRMVFYSVAIESNKDSVLVFEEPEAHAFPYYTKHLGERIALDENKNQYFIATHNPYLLTAIWEKSAPGDVAVFATYYKDYETRVKPLTADDMAWLFQADPFLGVSHLVGEAP
jgi:AAA15 family ATPase/GTPase